MDWIASLEFGRHLVVFVLSGVGTDACILFIIAAISVYRGGCYET